jgi:uncharacterized protein HemX
VETAIAAGGRVLLAATDELIASGFETRLGPGNILTSGPKILPAVEIRSTSRPRQLSSILVGFLTALALAIGIGGFTYHTYMQRKLDKKEAEVAGLSDEIKSLKKGKEDLQNQLAECKQRSPASREDLQEKFAALQSQMSDIDKKMEMLSQRSDVQKRFDDLQKKLDALTANLGKLLVKSGIPMESTKQTSTSK